jgi:thiol-disulfide isomerase/thioredoxin
VAADLPEGWKEKIDAFVKIFPDCIDEYESLLDESNDWLSDKYLISELNSLYKKTKNGKNNPNPSLNKLTPTETKIIGKLFNDLLSRSANKVLYINVWATWCSPCKSQMPFWIDLSTYFKDVGNIEFVTLCIESDRKIWKEYLQSNELTGKHYFLNSDQASLLKGKLNLNGVPKFIIVIDGEVINANANRPSDKNLIDDLTKLLKDIN